MRSLLAVACARLGLQVVSLPGVVLRLALLVQRVHKPVEFPQVQFLDKVVFPARFCVQVPLGAVRGEDGRHHPSRGAKADPHGPVCFSRPRRFPRCSTWMR